MSAKGLGWTLNRAAGEDSAGLVGGGARWLDRVWAMALSTCRIDRGLR